VWHRHSCLCWCRRREVVFGNNFSWERRSLDFWWAAAKHQRSGSFTRAHKFLPGQPELSARGQDGILDWEKAFSYRGCIERGGLTGAGACATPSTSCCLCSWCLPRCAHNYGPGGKSVCVTCPSLRPSRASEISIASPPPSTRTSEATRKKIGLTVKSPNKNGKKQVYWGWRKLRRPDCFNGARADWSQSQRRTCRPATD